MIEEIQLGAKRIQIIGTAHISQSSIDEVESVIRASRPDCVAVELCQTRYEAMRDQDQWAKMDIVKVVKEGKAPLLMANLLLAAYQRRMGAKLGVRPGAEMVKALQISEELGCQTQLADRDVSVTLKRAWARLGFWKRSKLLSTMILGGLDEEEITQEEVENLKEKDMLTEAIDALAKEMPEIKEVLIDERDKYLAQKIREAPGTNVVAVVGAGHLSGILKHIHQDTDLAPLSLVPPPGPWTSILKWGIPLSILAILAYGFTFMGADVSVEMVKRWVLACGTLAAVGALVAGGHGLTIASAFVAAPFTTLHPAIAAGWVAGLVEAYVRKPRVEDFENLATDITSFAGFRRNEITKILLVVVLSNLGSSLGTLVGIPWISSML